jgi:hypothetical protein
MTSSFFCSRSHGVHSRPLAMVWTRRFFVGEGAGLRCLYLRFFRHIGGSTTFRMRFGVSVRCEQRERGYQAFSWNMKCLRGLSHSINPKKTCQLSSGSTGSLKTYPAWPIFSGGNHISVEFRDLLTNDNNIDADSDATSTICSSGVAGIEPVSMHGSINGRAVPRHTAIGIRLTDGTDRCTNVAKFL